MGGVAVQVGQIFQVEFEFWFANTGRQERKQIFIHSKNPMHRGGFGKQGEVIPGIFSNLNREMIPKR
jgi:hypothetical protein